MADLGEICSHIGALLYWIEYAVQRRDEESCTSTKMDRARKVAASFTIDLTIGHSA